MNGFPQQDGSSDDPAPLVLVGGTGRSGTHVIASLLDQHPRYYSFPYEARFHAKPRGFPDLLSGAVAKADFLRKLRRYWWRRIPAGEPVPALLPGMPLGRKVRGLHRAISEEAFAEAVARFDAEFDRDREAACRQLFLDLLWPLAEAEGKRGLVEMTTDNVMQAGTLGRLFPEARFVLTVRDGRDAGSSKASRRQRRTHPKDVLSGVDWWLERMRRAEAGLCEIEADRVLIVGLDEFVTDRHDATLAELLEFLGVKSRPPVRRFFRREMNPENAHRERWREGLTEPEQTEVTRHYEAALGALEAEGSRSAPILRRSFEAS